jgi:hypothetical protein
MGDIEPQNLAQESLDIGQQWFSNCTNSEERSRDYINHTYKFLDPSNQQIRLLKIEPSESNTPISYRLQTFSLYESPTYIALSYRWGDPSPTKLIILDGCSFEVRINLYWFLYQAYYDRATYGRCYYWIDAICIDQGNIYERNHQVKLMSKIYAQADEVLVWLGSGYGSAMIFLRQLELELEIRAATGVRAAQPSPTTKEALSLFDFFTDEYWSRVWIIQEILLAQQIKVRCGVIQVSWPTLEEFFGRLTYSYPGRDFDYRYKADGPDKTTAISLDILRQRLLLSNISAKNLSDIKHSRYKQAVVDAHSPHLLSLLQTFACSQSTDVRDQVFALQGLAAGHTTIPVDYAMTAQDVYTKVMAKIIECENDCHTLKTAYFLAGRLGLSENQAVKELLWNSHISLHNCELGLSAHQFPFSSAYQADDPYSWPVAAWKVHEKVPFIKSSLDIGYAYIQCPAQGFLTLDQAIYRSI